MRRAEIIKKINTILKRHKIPKAYFFGSFARKEKNYHDIDIAIELPNSKFSLFDLVGMEQEIEKKIGIKADISVLRSLKPRIMPYVQKDLVEII